MPHSNTAKKNKAAQKLIIERGTERVSASEKNKEEEREGARESLLET